MKNTEMSLALHLARNSKDSRFGTALLEENTKETRLLDTRIQRLEKERYQKSMHVAQARKLFLHQRSSQAEPLLIVERPPSPDVMRKVAIIEQGLEDLEVPNYAKPLKRKTRAPSTLLTIDAFNVCNRKKTNVWEEAYPEPPKFQSVVLPSFALTKYEEEELERGRKIHRPRSFPGGSTPRDKKRSRSQGRKGQIKSLTPGGMLDCGGQNETSGTFITQLATDGTGTVNAKTGRVVKFTFKSDNDNAKNSKMAAAGKSRQLPVATALVATKNGFKIQKTSNGESTKQTAEDKSEKLKASIRRWLRNTNDLL